MIFPAIYATPRFFVLVFMMMCLFACSPENTTDEEPKVENPTFSLTQPEVLQVTEDSLSIQFNFGDSIVPSISEYGMVWYLQEDTSLLGHCVKSYYGKPDKSIVTFSLKSGLPISQTFYLRAFIKVNGQIFYSRFVTVSDVHSEPPVFNGWFPEKPLFNEQIVLKGSNFVRTNNPAYCQLRINQKVIIPDSVLEDAVYFKLSSECVSANDFNYQLNATLILFGKEYPVSNPCKILCPWTKLPFDSSFPYSFLLTSGTGTSLDKQGSVVFERGGDFLYSFNTESSVWTRTQLPDGFCSANLIFNRTGNQYVLLNGKLYSSPTGSNSWSLVTQYPSAYPTFNKPFFYLKEDWLYIGFFQFMVESFGETDIREFKRYSLSENRWETLSPMPEINGGVMSSFLFEQNQKIHIGVRRSNVAYDFSSNRRIWSYSITDDLWSWDFETPYSDYPSGEDDFSRFSFTCKGRVFMGFGSNMDWPTYCANDVWEFKKMTGTWEMIPPCPDHLILTAWFTVGDDVYLIGRDEDYENKYFYKLNTALLNH